MTADAEVRLTMSGKLSFSDEISLAQAADILGYLSSTQVSASGSSAFSGAGNKGGAGLGQRARGGISPKAALEASGAKTNPEKIVAFAVLVSQQTGKETITVEDVKPLFRQAREAAPANFTRDLDVAIRNSWISEGETNGEYYVMDKVLNVLDQGFEPLRSSKPTAPRTRSGSSTRRPRKAVTTPAAFGNAEVSPVISGAINYHKVKTKTDKYLWAVYAAKKHGVDAIDSAELVWLTDKLGEGIKSNDLNGYFKGNLKAGYVNKNNEGRVRITPNGIERIEGLSAEPAK